MSASRRTVMQGIGATLGLAALSPVTASAMPTEFNAVAYIADMRAIGVEVEAIGDGLHCLWPNGFGFDDRFTEVGLKWWKARKAHPDPNGAVFAALEAERVDAV